MKRTYVFLAVALASAAIATTVASAQRSTSSGTVAARSSRTATVQLRHTNLGSILVSSSGRTLYEFTRDHANKNSCAAISGCSSVWPSLKASGRPTAGSGVKASLLSLTSGKQVTYAGHPLYTYSGDSGPGQTSYVGAKQFGGTWYAISSSGGAVK
jgi:predicted lipoprotein with Yx(FWY)xxD motif